MVRGVVLLEEKILIHTSTGGAIPAAAAQLSSAESYRALNSKDRLPPKAQRVTNRLQG